MQEILLCLTCRHYKPKRRRTDKSRCSAFPDGIPLEILNSTVKHTEPYEGDNGIQYEAIDDNE